MGNIKSTGHPVLPGQLPTNKLPLGGHGFGESSERHRRNRRRAISTGKQLAHVVHCSQQGRLWGKSENNAFPHVGGHGCQGPQTITGFVVNKGIHGHNVIKRTQIEFAHIADKKFDRPCPTLGGNPLLGQFDQRR